MRGFFLKTRARIGIIVQWRLNVWRARIVGASLAMTYHVVASA